MPVTLLLPATMRFVDAICWFFALPDPAVDRSAMTPIQLSTDAHRRQLCTPFGRAMIRYHILLESIPHRVRALVGILWRATAGRWLLIKSADFAETEIATMRYVANHTDIPVPRVWFSFEWGNCEYIVMDRITGITLFDALRGGYLQDGDKQDMIAGQLARHMAQLRSLAPPPNSSISSVLGGPVRCPRLFQDPLYGPTAPAPPTGPFKSEATMNLQLRHLRSLEACVPVVVAAHLTAHPLVLTHNDLVPRNIMRVTFLACKSGLFRAGAWIWVGSPAHARPIGLQAILMAWQAIPPTSSQPKNNSSLSTLPADFAATNIYDPPSSITRGIPRGGSNLIPTLCGTTANIHYAVQQ
ncbi:hypothetical protein C8R44DRAFT_753162 [Mycena epipterygia]|nr:hypothetical protein C8R44DRAFT_753162 [Mycena epipterygia]